ncbi:MAG: GAF domain-containing protein [Desulforhopalus sp.]
MSENFLDRRTRTTTTETAKRALNGETLVVSDTTTDNSITFKDAMREEGIVTMIVTPIPVRDRIIGVLRLCSDIQRDFPDDVMVMVKALAHHGGLAIHNASMYLELQEDKKSLEADIWSHRSWF